VGLVIIELESVGDRKSDISKNLEESFSESKSGEVSEQEYVVSSAKKQTFPQELQAKL
jgi:hypothetical protein